MEYLLADIIILYTQLYTGPIAQYLLPRHSSLKYWYLKYYQDTIPLEQFPKIRRHEA